VGEVWTRSPRADRRRLAKSRKTEVYEKALMMMAAKIQTHPKPSRTSTGFNLSFTAASLRPELARIVAEHYLAARDWDLAKQRILSSNALQCRSAGSAVRLEREFRQRLGALTQEQLILAAEATADDCSAIAWLETPALSPPGKPRDKTPPPATQVRYTSATSLRPQCSIPYIATEADLDQWLAALRTAAHAELEKGNRISL
jgi:hypothetical protein